MMISGGDVFVGSGLSLLAFDLDGTLAVSKSPVTDAMASALRGLLDRFDVCVISGGALMQLVSQVVDRLHASDEQLGALHLMPTSGTGNFRFRSNPTLVGAGLFGSVAARNQAARDLRIDRCREGARILGI